ncbi:MAG: TspO/MBR family protein [Cyanobacteria bacterium]|nr:TspO/MBR family protein [Cyanobacteriota bacterium]
MIVTWLVIAAASVIVAVGINRFSPADARWFGRLRRPTWLTFEWAIPIIWTVIFLCGITSASLVWRSAPGASHTRQLMMGFLIQEALIMAFTPATLRLRSLRAGALIGGIGFVFGLFLTPAVWKVSATAGWLLVPYLIWSPIGTYTTWVMSKLNPESA